MQVTRLWPLSWSHKTSEVNEWGLRRIREASADEREKLAESLQLVECAELVAEYSINTLGSGAWLLSGNLRSRITQSCVVSLEPVEAYLSEPYSVEFRAGSTGAGTSNREHDALEVEDFEILTTDQIEVGRIIYDTLSAALDPYPRKEGVEFFWEDTPKCSVDQTASPFLVLKKFKPNA